MRPGLLIGLVVNTVALWVAVELLPNVDFDGGIFNLILISLAFGLVNTYIRPVVELLSWPLNFVTLGLFSFVVNGLMLLLVANFSSSLNFDGGFLAQLVTAVLTTIIISLGGGVLSHLLSLRG